MSLSNLQIPSVDPSIPAFHTLRAATDQSLTMSSTFWKGPMALFLLISALQVLQISAQRMSEHGFIRVGGYSTLGENGGGSGFQASFTDRKCRKFVFSGWNSREVIETAYGTSSILSGGAHSPGDGKELIKWVLDVGKGAGMTVMRFFGHGWGDSMRIQISPGRYNEDALRALDWVLNEAAKRHLMVVIALTDNSKGGDSTSMYVEAAGKAPQDFFTDPEIKDWFKAHLVFMANRRNTLTGVLYKNDPTILSWDLINEPSCSCNIDEGGPNCQVECSESINAWIKEMSEFMKVHDPNHMVVVGEEGFYSKTSSKAWVNPDAFFDWDCPWSERGGQDFLWNHQSPAIDYLGIHLWPDKWAVPFRWYQAIWLREHQKDAWHMLKPLVVEEFGKMIYNSNSRAKRTVRDPFLEQVYDALISDIESSGPIQGVSFWELDARGHVGKSPSPYGIKPTDTAWTELVDPYSRKVQDLSRRMPLESYCVPGMHRSYDAIFYLESIGQGADRTDDDDVYYITHGRHLDAEYVGRQIGNDVNGNSILQCLEDCEGIRGCIAFRYNYYVQGGTCKFYSEASKEFQWSTEGWQTFYKQKAFRSCVDEGCKYCDHNEICIACQSGPLYWDENFQRPVCSEQPQSA